VPLRRYAVLAGVAILALGSAAPTVAQIWLPLPQPLDAGQKWTVAAQLLVYVVMLEIGSWLVLARPGPMTWGFFFYLAGWRAQLLSNLTDEAEAAFPGGTRLWGTLELVALSALSLVALAGLITFALRFPYDRADGWRRSVERAAWLAYLPVATLCITAYVLTDADNAPLRGTVLIGYLAWVWCGAVGYLFAIAVLLLTFVRASGDARQRLLWIAVLPVAMMLREARLIGFFGDATVVPWLYQRLLLASVIVPIAVAYAILRHRVFDVDFALSRAMALGAVATLTGAIFLCVDWVLSRNVVSSPVQLAIYIAVALGVGFALNALQRRLSGGIDALLFRQRYLAQRALDDIGRSLYSIDSRPGLYALLVRKVPEVLGATSAAMFERLDDGGYLRDIAVGWPGGAAWHLLSDHPVALAASRRSVVRIDRVDWYDLEDMPAETRPALGISILAGGRAQALLLLGLRRNGTGFDGAVIASLRRLSDRASAIYDALPS
jgi:hypothetical protein